MKLLTAALSVVAAVSVQPAGHSAADPLITSVYGVSQPRGLMVTTGGWAYCEQARPIARRARYTLLCGRYRLDGYVGPGTRGLRRLDWGDPLYLRRLADETQRLHEEVGGALVLIGASYAGFGVASLAAHHPALRPTRLVVVDSYFDLVERRRHLPPRHETAREIDGVTGGSLATLRARSASPAGLARLVRAGTDLMVTWSISHDERREFQGATCDRGASAGTLAAVARLIGRPTHGFVTRLRHGLTFWRHGAAMADGKPTGHRLSFPPTGVIPRGSVCEP
jgi:hypothetical protein